MKKGYLVEAIVLALGIAILGFCLKGGIDNFVNKDRQVTVKGLAEREVPANKVTWPIVSKEIGDNLPTLYSQINSKNNAIKQFLIKSGLTDKEISVNAPVVIDKTAERYSSGPSTYRYNVTSIITVTSDKVDLVRGIIARQGELLKDGIAIVGGDYENNISYEFTGLNEVKGSMVDEAIKNAKTTAEQFAKVSDSSLGHIINASQGQFSIENRDENTPYVKKIRVVTTITYSLDN